MRIHLINPSDVSFGAAVITPRWLYVLAAATPAAYGDPQVIDETLEQIDMSTVSAGDVIGIGIHTLNALRGYEVGRAARRHETRRASAHAEAAAFRPLHQDHRDQRDGDNGLDDQEEGEHRALSKSSGGDLGDQAEAFNRRQRRWE